MTPLQHTVGQGAHGWFAQTRYTYNEGHVLTIFTMKRYGGHVATTADISEYHNGVTTHAVFQDFSVEVQRTKLARVTAKSLEAFHKQALSQAEDLIRRASEFYKRKERKDEVAIGG